MANNVRFFKGTKTQYLALSVPRNPNALFFCTDTQELYLGDKILTDGIRVIATRNDLPKFDLAADGVVYYCTDTKSGFMLAPTRDAWLQTIYAPVDDVNSIPKGEEYNVVTTVGAVRDIEKKIYERIDEVSSSGLSNLKAVDGTINIVDTINGGKSIGVAISSNVDNALVAVEGGLFVPTVVVPEYSIEKQITTDEGYAASYRLKKTVGDEVSYVGDTINIAKDMVLKSATLEVVAENDVPYVGAIIGDPYIKMVFNDLNTSNIYIPVKSLVDTYTAGKGIEIINNEISVKLANNTHGLVAVDGALTINLATRNSDGAMSKEDKKVIDSIPFVYMARNYDISDTPIGTIVDYRDKEIRVMCPTDTKWKLQNVGNNGNANMYYMTFKAYAPKEAVSFKEGDRGVVIDKMFTFDDTAAGVDEFGRKYSVCWLALASYDPNSDTWSYFGKNSSESRYIGWDYIVEWYNADGIKIAGDSIRINLSNEDCHNNIKPYYMANFATSEEIDEVRQSISTAEDSYTWGEI